MPTPVLITAGATRNPIDSMRCITANSTGRTGVQIAQHLLQNNVECTLLGSNLALRQPHVPDNAIEFWSTRDLMDKMREWVTSHPMGIVVHAAAVGDFEVANTSSGKIPSGQELILRLQATPKIVDHIHTWSPTARLISFKAAAPKTSKEQLLQIAAKQGQRTQSDWVFANVLEDLQHDVLLWNQTEHHWFKNRQDGLSKLTSLVLELGR